MGSYIQTNDTLQITSKQGFPSILDYEQHKTKAFRAENFEGQVFEFKDKEKIRIYHTPPVRNFLVHNINGKWLYWGLIHILEVQHDYVHQTTSGKFKIIYLYTPEEMITAHKLIDRNPTTDFLGAMKE